MGIGINTNWSPQYYTDHGGGGGSGESTVLCKDSGNFLGEDFEVT